MLAQKNKFKNLGLIVAMGENGEIGSNNNLIWKIKEDLNFFKNVTMDSYIIMGRNTYNSMPKNLRGRNYIVLSKNENFNLDAPKLVYRSVEETLKFISQKPASKFWVVGGGAIYEAFLPFINIMHITQIKDSYSNADTFFPDYNVDDWYQNIGEELCSENNIRYRHMLLQRKKKSKA